MVVHRVWLFCCALARLVDVICSHSGYAATFQGDQAIAGIRAGVVDFNDLGWRDIEESTVTFASWIKYYKVSDYGVPFRIATFLDNYLFDMQSGAAILSWEDTVSFGSVIDSEWRHYAAVVSLDKETNERTLTTYRDGQVINSIRVQPTFDLRKDNATLYLGGLLYTGGPISQRVRSNPHARFTGELDETVLFSRALNASEINALSKSPPGKWRASFENDVILYYDYELGNDALSTWNRNSQYVIRNLGLAGPKYDLLAGSLNNDFGFGDTYALNSDTHDSRVAYNIPGVTSSSIPWNGTRISASYSLVYYAGKSNEVARITVPQGTGAIRVATLPGKGTLRRGSNNATLAPNAIVTGEIFLEYVAPASPLESAVAFSISDSAATQQIHIWPALAPAPPRPIVRVVTVEGEGTQMYLGTKVVSPIGELPDMVVLSVPAGGDLVELEASWEWDSESIYDGYLIHTDLGTVQAPGHVMRGYGGLSVRYEPRLDFKGTDVFTVAFRTSDGVESAPLTIYLDVLTFNHIPTATATSATVKEDAEEGVEIELIGADQEMDFGLSFTIESLPAKGDLWIKDALGTRRKVTSPFNSADLGGSQSISQYASRILNTSSWAVSSDDLFYGHPLSMLGEPSCFSRGREVNDDCRSTKFMNKENKWLGWLPPVGEFVHADLHFNFSSPKRRLFVLTTVIEQYTDKNSKMLVVDLSVHDMFKQNEMGSWVRCFMQAPDVNELAHYPDDCSEDLALSYPTGAFVLRNVTWVDLKMVSGHWSGSYFAYTPGLQKGSPATAAYGPEFQFTWDQDEGYKSGAKPPFTEFVEFGFDTPVFPTAVFSGSKRGGGAIVSIKAKLKATGQWIYLYKGEALKKAYEESNALGLYYTFDETLCRANFLTDHIRIELDSSGETGITDWNFIDYVQLVGTTESQSAMLQSGDNKVVYVPRANHFGKDSFSFVTSDCLGKVLRNSEAATVSLSIESYPDPPLVSFSTSEAVFKCNVSDPGQWVFVDVIIDELEGGNVTFSVGSATPNVVVGVSNERPDLPPAEYPFAARSVRTVGISVDCSNSEVGSSLISIPLRAQGTSGRETNSTMSLRLLNEDRNPVTWPRGLSLALFAILAVLLSFLTCWTIINRRHPIVTAAQFVFVLILLLGCFIQSLALLFIPVDDVVGGMDADTACNLMVWCYCIGFMLTFAPLIVKLYRAERFFNEKFTFSYSFTQPGSRAWTRIAVSTPFLVSVVVLLVIVDIALLLAWMFSDDPLQFERSELFVDTYNDYVLKSVGKCQSSLIGYPLSILVYHFLILFFLSYAIYKSKDIDSSFAESSHLWYAVLSSIQVLVIAIPVMYITSENTDTLVFIRSMTVFLLVLFVLLFVFVPKLMVFYGIEDNKKPKKGAGIVQQRIERTSNASNMKTSEVSSGRPSALTHDLHSAKKGLKTFGSSTVSGGGENPSSIVDQERSELDESVIDTAHDSPTNRPRIFAKQQISMDVGEPGSGTQVDSSGKDNQVVST